MHFGLAIPTIFLCAVCSVDLWYSRTTSCKQVIIKLIMANMLLVLVLLMVGISYNSWFFSHYYETHLNSYWCINIATNCYFTSQLELTSLAISVVLLYGNFWNILDNPEIHIRSSLIILLCALLSIFLGFNLYNYAAVQYVIDDCYNVLLEPQFISSIGITWGTLILYLISFCFCFCFATSIVDDDSADTRQDRQMLQIAAFYFIVATIDISHKLYEAFIDVPNTVFQESFMDLNYTLLGLFVPVTAVPIAMIIVLQRLRHRFPLEYVDYITPEEEEKELQELSAVYDSL